MAESNPLLHRHLVDQLVAQLESAGLRQVEADPDFYVTYHGEVDQELRIDTDPFGYRFTDYTKVGLPLTALLFLLVLLVLPIFWPI